MIKSREQAERILKAAVAENRCPTGENFTPIRVPKAVRRFLKRNGDYAYCFADDLDLLEDGRYPKG